MAILISLYACSEHPKEQQSADTPTSTQADQSRPASGLTFNEMPNEDTRYVTIETDSVDENETLLLALQTRLLKANFEFIEKDSGSSWSENDCSLNKVIQVKGEGIRSYKAISKVKLGDEKQYRPDFVLLVFAFKDEQLAEQSFQMLKSAVYSAGGYCNGKSPETIVRNGNEIFYFTTREEAFRSYIDDYAKFIHELNLSKLIQNIGWFKVTRTAQIFIVLASFLIYGCQAQVKVDENFIKQFSPEIRPQVISICEQYDSNDQVQGIYFSRYAFGLYTFIGIKNNRFEILSFDDVKYSPIDEVSDIELQTGQYIKRNDQIILKTEKLNKSDPLANQSADFENFIYLQNAQSAFLIKDIEDVASSMSWSQTMGSARSQFKKIHCHIQDYHHYKGDEEPSPSYQALPERFKALVFEQPLHLTIKSAEDISKSLERNDDSETVIEQTVQILSGNTQKLFMNQPICIIQGQGKGLYGYINQPSQPLTKAWMSFEQGASMGIARQGDIISTSYQECKSLN